MLPALLISAIAAFKASAATALSLAATAASTYFIAVLTLDLIALFLAAFVSLTKILFFADLMLANVNTSNIEILFPLILFGRPGHGTFHRYILVYFKVGKVKCQYIIHVFCEKLENI